MSVWSAVEALTPKEEAEIREMAMARSVSMQKDPKFDVVARLFATIDAIRASIAKEAFAFVPYDTDPDHGQCPLCGEDGTPRSEVEAYTAALRAAGLDVETLGKALHDAEPHERRHTWGDCRDRAPWLSRAGRILAKLERPDD